MCRLWWCGIIQPSSWRFSLCPATATWLHVPPVLHSTLAVLQVQAWIFQNSYVEEAELNILTNMQTTSVKVMIPVASNVTRNETTVQSVEMASCWFQCRRSTAKMLFFCGAHHDANRPNDFIPTHIELYSMHPYHNLAEKQHFRFPR